ncbi:hypothetical protein C7H85_04975 [Zobellella endophytica]|uniref:Pilus assembly protein TadE n=1 Tax=Zobellella endophytica TaxID=2116700 RepID=A0A2P7RD62_9GAMM|nr:hypothetical protein C7H85_04975 [Zobellella endophytica]
MVLPVIMLVFYAIVTYGLIFYIHYLFNHIGAEALRRSVSYVNESCLIVADNPGCTELALKNHVNQEVELLFGDFLADPARILGQPRAEALEVTAVAGDCCTLQFRYNYQDYPFIPPLLPVPDVIVSTAGLRL